MTRVLVVLNAGSGGAGDAGVGELADALRPLGDILFTAPSDDGFADELRRAARGADVVVAAGGDGTASRTVDALGDRLGELRFGVVPMGTGNDLARTLGMPEQPLEAAEALATGIERTIDVWRAEGSGASRLFVNACVGGFPVEVDERLGDAEKRVLGPVAYLTAGARVAATMDRFTARLNDGDELTDCLAVGVGNGATVGAGIPLFPHADPGDGKLEVCALSANGTTDTAKLGLAVRKGEHALLEGVVAARGNHIRIETDPQIELNRDGDLVGLKTPVEFRHAGTARFLVPANATD